MRVIQELLGYVLLGAIGIVFLAVCCLPVFLLLRKKIPVTRQLAYFLFGACVLVIAGVTFLEEILLGVLDGRSVLSTEHFLNLVPFQFLRETWKMGMRKQITQEIANVMMFVPLGFLIPAAFRKKRRFWKTTVCAMAFSFLIEFVQYFIGRSADIDDLMLNTVGGMLGYTLFYGVSKGGGTKKLWKKFIGTD